jgi:hypothetical protein
VYGEIGFQSFCQLASGKHHAPAASFAFQPDIRTETHDGPFIGAAWMLFPQAQVVVESQVREHGFLQTLYRLS